MSKYVDDVYARISILLGQMHNNLSMFKPQNKEAVNVVLAPYIELLESIFVNEIPIARIRDESNLIIHAEGEALSEHLALKPFPGHSRTL